MSEKLTFAAEQPIKTACSVFVDDITIKQDTVAVELKYCDVDDHQTSRDVVSVTIAELEAEFATGETTIRGAALAAVMEKKGLEGTRE